MHVSQVLASLISICMITGFPGLYATLVCVAWGQLEKLRKALLGIRQTYVTSEQDIRDETGQHKEKGQGHISEDVIRHMQKQLNNCIRHHQDIQRWVYKQQVKCHLLCIAMF
jgi:hypothetical protein